MVNRWPIARRGMIMGLRVASTATGSLLFLPDLVALAHHFGWQAPVMAVAAVTLILVPPVALFLPEHPADRGLVPHRAEPDHEPLRHTDRNPLRTAITALLAAARQRDFWFLFASFFVCCFTTNGLIGSHFITICADHGIEGRFRRRDTLP